MTLNRKTILLIGAATAVVISGLAASADSPRFRTTERLPIQQQMSANFS